MQSAVASFFRSLSRDDYLLKTDVPLSSLLTFRAGGRALFYTAPRSMAAMVALLTRLELAALPFHLLGAGSNTLPPDGDYSGLLVSSSQMREAFVSRNMIYAECGASLPLLSAMAAKHSLSGMEELSSIPGSLGGALYMNAGAYGKTVGELVRFVIVYDGENKKSAVYNKAGSFFSYRSSLFRERKLPILGAVLSLRPARAQEIAEKKRLCLEKRTSSQPLALPSAGSIFRASEGAYAGRLIEEAGLKGAHVGGAAVSEKHAGFIVNEGGALPEEIDFLIALVRERVRENSGLLLMREAEYFEEGVGRTCPIQVT